MDVGDAIVGDIGDTCGERVVRVTAREGWICENYGTAAEIACELGIGLTISDDVGGIHVDRAVHVGGQHAGARLSAGVIVLGGVAVDMLVVKSDALPGIGVHDELMENVESLLGVGGRAQPILVGDEDELEIGMLADESEIADGTGDELDVGERADLLGRRLLDERAVAVDEEDMSWHRGVRKI